MGSQAERGPCENFFRIGVVDSPPGFAVFQGSSVTLRPPSWDYGVSRHSLHLA